ncbi:transporter substrate-binding domain-containing protein [Acerihabitans sp. KWT182]|uniref:Transporter substrate-binding domain-containing protein n=1 Tax=Acerihabitans sp. KWT182 TaxID=3157919 RepID=A0AAU7QFA2_9GAMM
MRQGRGAAYTGDIASLITLVPANPDVRMLPINQQYDVQYGGGGIRKGETEWKTYLDAVLTQMKAQNFYGPVVDKYIKNDQIKAFTLATYEGEPPKK